jgi:hypothetical protein
MVGETVVPAFGNRGIWHETSSLPARSKEGYRRHSLASKREFAMSSYADRLAALREQLKADKLDGFVVPLT